VAPPDLTDLSPKYIGGMPSSRFVSEVLYAHADGEQRWRLTLVSTATGKRRYYIAERGMPLSGAEKKQRKVRYHGTWSVIEPK
jgi:hypothetical protein